MAVNEHRKPARATWLWAVLTVGLVLFGAGAYLSRVNENPVGIVLVVVGLGVVITFTVLQRRYGKK